MNRTLKTTLAAVTLSALMFQAGSVYGQERAMHPRLATAINALRDARAYLAEAPHDFGGHKAGAIAAIDAAITQINFALEYRGAEDGRPVEGGRPREDGRRH